MFWRKKKPETKPEPTPWQDGSEVDGLEAGYEEQEPRPRLGPYVCNTNEELLLMIAEYGRLIQVATQSIVSEHDFVNDIVKYADRARFLANHMYIKTNQDRMGKT
jgi:hypothetical protein